MRKSALACVSLVVALTGAGAVSAAVSAETPSHATSSHVQPVAKVKKITISMFTFSPGTLTVSPGAKIKIVNKDVFAHTLTSDDGTSFDNAVPASSTVVFKAPTTPGTYNYHCNIHLSMHGILIVKKH